MYDPNSPFLKPRAPLAPGQKSDVALYRLRQAVLWCEVPAGEIVAEAGLAARFGLARAAVRVALHHLAAEGLVAPQARQGWRVRAVTGALAGHVLAARRQVEPALAEVALGAADLAQVERIAAVVAATRGRAATLEFRRQALRELDDLLLARINPLLGRFLAGLLDQSDRIVRHLESRGTARFEHDATPALAAALAGQDRAGVTAARLAALDALERFVVRHLLADPHPLAAAATAAPQSPSLAAGPVPGREDHRPAARRAAADLPTGTGED
jgi:DNA-binding GntR family transcriptional regulator